MRCAYDAGDDATQRDALEKLVAHTGKAEYWNDLLKMGEAARACTTTHRWISIASNF